MLVCSLLPISSRRSLMIDEVFRATRGNTFTISEVIEEPIYDARAEKCALGELLLPEAAPCLSFCVERGTQMVFLKSC